jgi:hypothetical protein
VFIPQIINSAIVDLRSGKNVVKKYHNHYRAHTMIQGILIYLDAFETYEEALFNYKDYRRKYIQKLAQEYSKTISKEAFNALISWDF